MTPNLRELWKQWLIFTQALFCQGLLKLGYMLSFSRIQFSVWNIDDCWQRENDNNNTEKHTQALKASAWNLHRSFPPIFLWLEKVTWPLPCSVGLGYPFHRMETPPRGIPKGRKVDIQPHPTSCPYIAVLQCCVES